MHKPLITRYAIVMYALLSYGRFNAWETLQAERNTSATAIARITGLSERHVSNCLNKLIKDKLVEQRYLHIPGEKLKKRVYRLTDKGIECAKNFEAQIKQRKFLYRIEHEEGLATLEDLSMKTGLTVLDILVYARHDRIVIDDRSRMAPGFSRVIPYVPARIYGREAEIKLLRDFEKSDARICIISGIDGIGKTTLLRDALSAYHKKYMLFEVRTYTSGLSVFLQDFSSFLTHISVLSKSTAWNVEKLKQDILAHVHEIDAVLAIDDFQNADEELAHFIMELAERSISQNTGLKIILVSSSRGKHFSVHDRMSGRVLEINPQPLDFEHAKTMLAERGVPAEKMHELYEITHGIPALLELVNYESTTDTMLSHDFVERDILGKLTEAELKVLSAAALFILPFEPEAIFAVLGLGSIDYEMLEKLHDCFLLKRDVTGRYALNEVVRNAILKKMPQARISELHWRICEFYEKQGEHLIHALYHAIESQKLDEIENFIARNRYVLLNRGNLPLIERYMNSLLEKMRIKHWRSESILLFYGEIMETMGFWDKAEWFYRRLPENPGALIKLAGLLIRRGADPATILKILENVKIAGQYNSDELHAQLYYHQGLLAEYSGDLNTARENYHRAINICTKISIPIIETYAWLGLARTSLYMGEHEQCMRLLANVKNLMLLTDGYIERALLYIALGSVYRELKKHQEEIGMLEEALKFAQQVGEKRLIAAAYIGLAGAYIGLEQYATAEKYFQNAVSVKGEISDWHMRLNLEALRLFFWDSNGKDADMEDVIKPLKQLLQKPVNMLYARSMAQWCDAVLALKTGKKKPVFSQLAKK